MKTAKDITVDEFLAACRRVMDKARTSGYVYGNSTSRVPTADGRISCDRLIAKALWDLGFTDQRTGGETCGTLDSWLKQHGFYRSTRPADIREGSIVLVKHAGKSYISHAFVCVAYDKASWRTDRYDAGSNDRIKTSQPLRGLPWGYRQDDVIVYNIRKFPVGGPWMPTGTATARIRCNVRTGPAAGYKKIRPLNRGNRFEINGDTCGSWVRVKVVDTIGWLWSPVIKYDM